MKDTIIVILTLLLLGLVVWDSYFRDSEETNTEIQYVYKTDTVFIDQYYEVPIPQIIESPPHLVTIYKVDSSIIDSLKIVVREKDIIISDLENSVTISKGYLGGYLGNPKLLGLRLTPDSLALGLLEISGRIIEDSWAINNQDYVYHWDFENDMTMKKIEKPKPKLEFTYYVGGGYDFLHLSPFISGKIQTSMSRIVLYSRADIGLLSNEIHQLQIGVDYKLNGKENRNRIK